MKNKKDESEELGAPFSPKHNLPVVLSLGALGCKELPFLQLSYITTQFSNSFDELNI